MLELKIIRHLKADKEFLNFVAERPPTIKITDGEHIDQVWNQSAYMYYNVAKSTNVTINILDAYGSYQHAQSTVNISSLASIILNPSAYNIIQFADSGIASKYDNMRKTHAQLTGLNW